MDRDSVIRKIKSLLALSDDQSNENESYVAMLMARKLMIKYHIENSEVVDLHDESSEVVELKLVFTFNKRYTYYYLYLCGAIAKYNRCKILSGSYSYQQNKSIYIIGEKSDAEYVKSVCEYAHAVMENCLHLIHTDLYARGYRRDLLVTMKSSWAYGYVDGLRDYYERQTVSEVGGSLMCIIPDTVIQYASKYGDSHDSKDIQVDRSLYDRGYEESRDFFNRSRLEDKQGYMIGG